MLKAFGVALLACTGLAACAPSGVSMAPGPGGAVAFACPAPGTQVRRVGSSAVLTSLAPDPADPVVCPIRDQAGVESRWLYGLFRVPTSIEPTKRAALANAFGGGPEQCYTETLRTSGAVGFSPTPNDTYIYEHCWKQGGRRTIEVNGRRFDTVAIIDTDEGRAGNVFAADRIFHFDLVSKAMVRLDVNNRRGTPAYGYSMAVLKTPAL